MAPKIQKNEGYVDATLNAKGSTGSKVPVIYYKDAAYFEELTWNQSKKKGGSELLGEMDSKFVGQNGPDGNKILEFQSIKSISYILQ